MFDDFVIRWAAAHRVGLLSWCGKSAAALAGPREMAVITLVGTVVLVILGKVRVVLTAGAAATVALVLTTLLKKVFARPRPPDEFALVEANGYSMPSTDSATVAALLLAVALTWPLARRAARRWLVIGAVVAATVVGLLTVYVGAHWLTDVLVGLPIGFALAVAADRVGRLIRPRRA